MVQILNTLLALCPLANLLIFLRFYFCIHKIRIILSINEITFIKNPGPNPGTW